MSGHDVTNLCLYKDMSATLSSEVVKVDAGNPVVYSGFAGENTQNMHGCMLMILLGCEGPI